MKCMWNKMAFNVHSFCNNKLKITITFHCFMYSWKSSGSFAAPCVCIYIYICQRPSVLPRFPIKAHHRKHIQKRFLLERSPREKCQLCCYVQGFNFKPNYFPITFSLRKLFGSCQQQNRNTVRRLTSHVYSNHGNETSMRSWQQWKCKLRLHNHSNETNAH
jgi:hypothetical protein